MEALKNLNVDNYTVRSYHADFKQQLNIVSLFNFLQESAWHHAASNAFGFNDLLNKGFFWALTRVKAIIKQYPMWGDEFRVETWSKEPDALIAYRDFEAFDKNNRQLVIASSAWLIVDIKSRRPQRMARFKDDFPHLLTRHAIENHPEKLPKLPEEGLQTLPVQKINVSDMDMNGHVNNANYVRWVIDSFPSDFIAENCIQEIDVNFLHESKADEHFIVNICKQAEATYLCNVVRTEDNCELARINIIFGEKA